MRRKSLVIFPSKQIEKQIFKQIAKEQTERLIAYAQQEIKRIGNDISVYPNANMLDRTGNLLDSLCWIVCYDGKVNRFGYYRATTAFEESHLHEYSNPMGEAVNGRVMAQRFIASYSPPSNKGWNIAFAVLAPYWGYWEKGFTHPASGEFFQWQVMTHHYDIVKSDLAPTRVTLHTYIPA